MIRSLLLKLHAWEATPLGEQVFRAVRLFAIALVAQLALISGPVTIAVLVAAIASAAEVAFRQLVPTAGSLWSKLITAGQARAAEAAAAETPPQPAPVIPALPTVTPPPVAAADNGLNPDGTPKHI